MLSGGRSFGSAIAPAALLAAVLLGLFLFVWLLNTHANPVRLEVSKPALVRDQQSACPVPCFTVNVTNVGGTPGNVMCQVEQPAVFFSGGGGNYYLGITPLQPNQTWVLSVRMPDNKAPAPVPVIQCSPV